MMKYNILSYKTMITINVYLSIFKNKFYVKFKRAYSIIILNIFFINYIRDNHGYHVQFISNKFKSL